MGWFKERVIGSKITTMVGLGCAGIAAIGAQMQYMDGVADYGKILQGIAMVVGSFANILARD